MRIEETLLTKRNGKRILELKKLQDLDEYKPNIHLMPLSGLLNDPNGLCYIGGKYHIFYQWSPFCTDHGLKHWGHYSTKDFISFTHHKVGLRPTLHEENAGCFTGATLVENGVAHIFYTGNIIEEDGQKTPDGSTIYVTMNEKGEIQDDKKVLFRIDRNRYTHDYRDPYPFKSNGKYYLLHGAKNKQQQGMLSIYYSDKIDSNYKLLGDIRFSRLQSLGKMVECPNIFRLRHYDVLMISPNKMDPYLQNDEKPIYITGHFNDPESLFFDDEEQLRFVDHGFEFYAPQAFTHNKRVIVIGWFGQVRLKPYPNLKYQWANTLTLPRELSIKNKWIYQQPIKELLELREKTLESKNGIYNVKHSRSYELLIDNKNIKPFEICLKNDKGENISIRYQAKTFYFERGEMTLPFYPEFGERRILRRIDIRKVRIFFDVSMCEIFINDGQYTMTGRYFVKNVSEIKVSGAILNSELHILKNLKVKIEEII